MNSADIIINIYVLESTVKRCQKLFNKNNNLILKAISNVSLYECVNNIKFSSNEALVSFMEGKKLEDSVNTINNLKYSEKVIKFYTDKNLRKNSFFSIKENRMILNYNEFFSQPHEIILRSLSNLIKSISKNYY